MSEASMIGFDRFRWRHRWRHGSFGAATVRHAHCDQCEHAALPQVLSGESHLAMCTAIRLSRVMSPSTYSRLTLDVLRVLRHLWALSTFLG